MSKINILIVDDEKEIADLIKIYLSDEQYNVLTLYDGTEVMNVLKQNDISLLILDIMMPTVDGLTVCKQVREQYNIPIIMLSAKSLDTDKIIGLSIGADDYITKPFNPIELIARVRAQLRRFMKLNPHFDQEEPEPQDESIIEINGLVINKHSYTTTLYDKEISLTPIEFEILYLLASHANTALRSEKIFEEIWGEKYYEASNNTIMVHIRHLRKKLEDNSKNPKFIKTIWGVGYKFEK